MTSRNENRFEKVTRSWWFYLLMMLISFIPSYSEIPVDPQNTNKLVLEVISNPVIYSFTSVYALFKIVPLVLVVSLVIFKGRTTRPFYLWAGFSLFVMAVFQNMGYTKSYGFAVLIGNVIMLAFLAVLWFIAAYKQPADSLDLSKPAPLWRYWVVIPAILAFWFPIQTGASGIPVPDFSLSGFFLNEAGLTFCMMMAVYNAVLVLAYPRVDIPMMRVSGATGFAIGILNVIQFLLSPQYGPWMAFLHMPLLFISLNALILALRKKPIEVH
ncbi:MAG: hypothetical protein WA110_00210 [Anaerolineaceae bacterium]